MYRVGLEPTTCSLKGCYSTIELPVQGFKSIPLGSDFQLLGLVGFQVLATAVELPARAGAINLIVSTPTDLVGLGLVGRGLDGLDMSSGHVQGSPARRLSPHKLSTRATASELFKVRLGGLI
jgi:hypothetical protein